MKSIHLTSTLKTVGCLGIALFSSVELGCNRGDKDGVPVGPAVPEVPIVPKIDPARPALEGSRNAHPTGTTPSSGRLGTSAETGGGGQREAKATFQSAPKMKLSGDAKLEEVATGVKIVIEIENAPPGKKGAHVHEKGDCSDIPGKSMGEHFAPAAAAHALPPNSERHLGDLGNIDVEQSGKARLEITVPNANLKKDDPMSFLGRALVIHEAEDKGSQPSGDSGKPMACAVIAKN